VLDEKLKPEFVIVLVNFRLGLSFGEPIHILVSGTIIRGTLSTP
jgi:hypothetical protein